MHSDDVWFLLLLYLTQVATGSMDRDGTGGGDSKEITGLKFKIVECQVSVGTVFPHKKYCAASTLTSTASRRAHIAELPHKTSWRSGPDPILQGEIQQLSSRISILTEEKRELEERETREKVTDNTILLAGA